MTCGPGCDANPSDPNAPEYLRGMKIEHQGRFGLGGRKIEEIAASESIKRIVRQKKTRQDYI